MWTLPSNRHTHALTDLIEEQFYSRISNDKRPKHYRESDLADPKSSLDEKAKREKDTEKAVVQEGDMETVDASPAKNNTEKGKRQYSKRPLLAAVHSAFFWRWWTAGFLLLCSSKNIQSHSILSDKHS